MPDSTNKKIASSAVSKSPWIAIPVIVALVVSVTLFFDAVSVFSRIESASFDHRVAVYRSDVEIHSDVVVVLIDDASLQAMDEKIGRWPWPRSAYVDLLDYFSLGGAHSLALDILFTEQQTSDSNNRDDQLLIMATRRAGNTVHSMQLLDSSLTGVKRPLPANFSGRFALSSTAFTGSVYGDFLLPIEDLYLASRDVGYLELTPDRDGVYRRLRLFNQSLGGEVYPALSVAMIMGLFTDEKTIFYRENEAEIGDLKIPLDGNANLLVNPYGIVKPISVVDIFDSMQQIRSGITPDVDPAQFEGKLVLLGASAIGLDDVKATAMSAASPGVVIHASTVSNILNRDFLKVSPPYLLVIVLLLMCSLATAIAIFLSRLLLLTFIATSVLVTLYISIVYISFGLNYVIPMSPVIFATVLTLLISYGWRSWKENDAKQKIRKMLGQYVSPAVLTEVIDNQEDLHAEIGSTENLSILFSDIRGFTNISENMEASKVVDLLNIYFSDMTEIIFHHKGTLDKFIGDAIMAFWGAPIKNADHPQQALRSAVEMVRKLRGTNERLLEKGYPEISIGIGIHSGEVVLGNIGSDKKLDYTIIGDSVNLASRLEGLTKNYGSPVLISETSFESLRAEIPCLLVDRVRVKGKEKPITLYAPAQLFLEENNLDFGTEELIEKFTLASTSYLKSGMGDC